MFFALGLRYIIQRKIRAKCKNRAFSLGLRYIIQRKTRENALFLHFALVLRCIIERKPRENVETEHLVSTINSTKSCIPTVQNPTIQQMQQNAINSNRNQMQLKNKCNLKTNPTEFKLKFTRIQQNTIRLIYNHTNLQSG